MAGLLLARNDVGVEMGGVRRRLAMVAVAIGAVTGVATVAPAVVEAHGAGT